MPRAMRCGTFVSKRRAIGLRTLGKRLMIAAPVKTSMENCFQLEVVSIATCSVARVRASTGYSARRTSATHRT